MPAERVMDELHISKRPYLLSEIAITTVHDTYPPYPPSYLFSILPPIIQSLPK
jgi:hypothetical protein